MQRVLSVSAGVVVYIRGAAFSLHTLVRSFKIVCVFSSTGVMILNLSLRKLLSTPWIAPKWFFIGVGKMRSYMSHTISKKEIGVHKWIINKTDLDFFLILMLWAFLSITLPTVRLPLQPRILRKQDQFNCNLFSLNLKLTSSCLVKKFTLSFI